MSLTNTPWTPSDIKTLARLYRKGAKDAEIAQKLMRTVAAVKRKRADLGLIADPEPWHVRKPAPRKAKAARRYRNRADPSIELEMTRAENDTRTREARERLRTDWQPGQPAY